MAVPETFKMCVLSADIKKQYISCTLLIPSTNGSPPLAEHTASTAQEPRRGVDCATFWSVTWKEKASLLKEEGQDP